MEDELSDEDEASRAAAGLVKVTAAAVTSTERERNDDGREPLPDGGRMGETESGSRFKRDAMNAIAFMKIELANVQYSAGSVLVTDMPPYACKDIVTVS